MRTASTDSRYKKQFFLPLFKFVRLRQQWVPWASPLIVAAREVAPNRAQHLVVCL